jgi:hypothetical protein
MATRHDSSMLIQPWASMLLKWVMMNRLILKQKRDDFDSSRLQYSYVTRQDSRAAYAGWTGVATG